MRGKCHEIYQNVRGYHWSVKGPPFFQLHETFEEFYTDLLVKVDEVAERILTLGHTPVQMGRQRGSRHILANTAIE